LPPMTSKAGPIPQARGRFAMSPYLPIGKYLTIL
jgi:hypothetical protein